MLNFSIALLPGPGSYDANEERIVKFERTPVAFLPRRQRAAQSRNVIDFATLTINPDRYDFTPKGNHKLDPVKDPYKKQIAYTIGERRKLLNQPGTFLNNLLLICVVMLLCYCRYTTYWTWLLQCRQVIQCR